VLLPALLYGDWKDVRPRVKAIVRRVKRSGGEDFLRVVTEAGMLDTATTDGMLMLGGTMRPGWTSFHCHEPWKHLEDAITDDEPGRALEEQIFQASLTVHWGVLGLMAPSNTLWFAGHRERETPFLDAALKAWDEIDAVGARYFMAFEGERMWSFPNSLKHVLARAGVPIERLKEPLPKGGPSTLLKYARASS
jgi:hypothetical protein